MGVGLKVFEERKKQRIEQPRSQGLSSLLPLSLRKDNDNGGREETLGTRLRIEAVLKEDYSSESVIQEDSRRDGRRDVGLNIG